MRELTRRRFVQGAAAVTAGLALGACESECETAASGSSGMADAGSSSSGGLGSDPSLAPGVAGGIFAQRELAEADVVAVWSRDGGLRRLTLQPDALRIELPAEPVREIPLTELDLGDAPQEVLTQFGVVTLSELERELLVLQLEA
jgi:hypothetical protein